MVVPGVSSSKNSAPFLLRPPTKPAYWTTPIPREVKYAPPGNLNIQSILASIHDKRTLGNTLIILKDIDDPQRPLYLITTPKSKFFPRGNWCAYLCLAGYPDPFDYHPIGCLTVSIEPAQIPLWLTWRWLSRQLRQQIDPSNKRRLRAGKGLLINPGIATIVPLCREVG